MDQTVSSFIAALVTEEIRRTVADAIKSGAILSAAAVAAQVSRTYPNCGLTEEENADQVMMAAAKAGVAVGIGKGDGPVRVVRRAFDPRRPFSAANLETLA